MLVNSEKQRLILLISWTVFTFVLLVIPMPISDGSEISYVDKFVHLILFGCFSFFLSYYLLIKKVKCDFWKILTASFVISFLYAVVMELIQSYVPSRTKSVFDLLFGLLGIVIFTSIFYGIYKKR